MTKLSTFIYLSIILFLTGSTTVFSQDLLQWRGIDRTGSFESTNLLDEWPEEGPKLALQVDNLPKSYSSIIKKGDILFTTGIEDSLEILTAIKMDGTVLWNTVYGKAWTKSFPNARCTPTIEGDNAYLISGYGHMASVNINTGALNWSIDAFTKYEGSHGSWGYAESPLIIDNKMIYSPGGDKTTMVAVNKYTGENIWMSQSLNDNSAYCSPVLVERGNKKLVVTVTATYVICIDSDNGDILWKFDYGNLDKPGNGSDINPVTPLVRGNEIFVTSGYNHIGVMLQMAEDLKSVKIKWKSPLMDVHHGGVVYHEGYIYGANYSTVVSGDWLCIKWENGEVQYEHDWHGKGSIISSNNLLICYDERRGNLALVKANPAKFEILSTFRIKPGGGPHWSHPTIYDDLLLMRHGASLVAYDIGAK